MNWALSECLQYRTAFWIREGWLVRPVTRGLAAKALMEMAG